jgi:hypothetical protein
MTARTAGRAWAPEYEGDEVALGVALAFALHAIPIAAIILRVYFPAPVVDEQPLVSQPVIGANLLKLGKPLDPKQLPDRLVPKARTAPQHQIVASREEPPKHTDKPDAGLPPPPNTQDSDIQRLIAKTDPFAEKNVKDRPEQGFVNGSDAGSEMDPSKVHAGEAYAALLQKFFEDRWQIPTVISTGDERRLCVGLTVAIDPRMHIWFVKQAPDRPSGNDLFDDSARSMLQKLADDRSGLPEPPPEIAEQFKGRRIQLRLGKGCR